MVPTHFTHLLMPKHRCCRLLLALAISPLLAGCMADPEKARYIGNDRIIGNYTETQVGEAARNTAGVAARIGLEIFTHWDFGDCD